MTHLSSSLATALPASLGQRLQLAYVVKDMDAALAFWTQSMKVGPFVTFEESLGERRFVHRGRRSDVSMSVALGYMGEHQIELIALKNDAPSTYAEFLRSGREGLHHLGYFLEDWEKPYRELQAIGFEEVSCIEFPDGSKSAIYLEGPAVFGITVEVAPLTDARRAYFTAIEGLSRRWNGERPVRRYRSRAEFLASDDGLSQAHHS